MLSLKGAFRAKLPHTFRDAVDFAHRLGIRLIWIDCYCIIQSSNAPDATFSIDKIAEIAAMKDVYTHALINIGAAHGSGPHAGCFVEREPLQYEYRRFKWRPRASEQRNWFCIREDDVEEPNGLYVEQKLFHRAWVMQERLLTPRMIHFTDKHLYWECSERNLANESFPEGMPEYGRQSNYARIWPDFSVEIDENCDYLELWEHMVRHYSKLALSAPAQDKLVAIGAAAALVAGRSNDAYLAGHFRNELLRSLCWYVYARSDVVPLQRLLKSGAPSWSWSSMNGEILFRGMFNHEEPMASIEDVQIQLADSKNPFGAVKSGKLLLKGRMLDASIAQDSQINEHGIIKLRISIEGISHDVRFREVFSSREEFDSFRGPLFFVPLLWKAHYVGTEEFLLASREDRARESSWDPECIVGVLLLRRADGCFVRLHLLEWASSELAEIWATTKEELISWI